MKNLLRKLLTAFRRAWRWLSAPFVHMRRHYEPWMMSSFVLMCIAAGLSWYWVYNTRFDDSLTREVLRIMLPFLLLILSLVILGATLFTFWRPKARNILATQLFLGRLYRPWMLSVLSVMAIGAMGYGFWKMQAKNPAAVLPDKPITDPGISLRFEDVELRGRKMGTPFFTIRADKVEVSKDNRYVTFIKGKNKPHGEFYNLKDWEEDPSGGTPRRRAITWEANKAIFDTQDQNLTMEGQVRVKTDAGDRIQTEQMIWNRNEEMLSSDTRTLVDTHYDTHIGSNKLKVNTRTKALDLEGRVFIDMKIGEDEIINVEELDN